MTQLTSSTQRRGFLGSVAAGMATLAAGRWSLAHAELSAPTLPGDEWVAKITGKHKQVFDCVSSNDGFGAAFPVNYIDSAKQATKLSDKDFSAVVVYRHFSMPLALKDSIWAKYKIGAMLKVNDPKTNAPATRNIFRDNVPLHPGVTYEQLMANRGIIIVACDMALSAFSGMTAANAGVTPEAAKKEWTANLLPGVSLAPSGVYAVNRAQEAGCTYCFGG
ncbi:MAG TPA: hypothetical protein VHV78_13170 [Gemmatimonadaceae bacterium]|jgi:hypothetical protein|nr:hypothetical protein [Gemmatimonadaceae bacterium]